MNIWQEKLGEKSRLVGVSGRLDQNLTPALEEQFEELLAQGHHRLVVDLTNVTYINSGGLRCLVSAWRKAKKAGGNLILTGLNDRVQKVFAMVGFDKVFEIYPNQKSAQEKWQKPEE